jgi:hypothetical protein
MPRYLLNPRHQPSEGGVVQAKSHRLSEAGKAAIFSVMLLTLALAAALLIRALDPPQMLAYIIWGLHNASWGALAALTVTSSPVLVNEDLAGDTGLFILMFTVVAAFWVRRWLLGHPQKMS